LIYLRTKSITRNTEGFIERLLRAAQTVFGGRMRLSKQWLKTTALLNCELYIGNIVQLWCNNDVLLDCTAINNKWRNNYYQYFFRLHWSKKSFPL